MFICNKYGKNNNMNVILLFFLFIVAVFLIGIFFSKISVQLETMQELDKNKKLFNYTITVRVYWFHIIKISKITTNNKKLKQNSKKNNKTRFKIDREIIKIIKKYEPKIEKLNLQIKIDTQNVILTSFITVLLSIIISNIFTKFSNLINKQQCKYFIQPLYNSEDSIELKLNCIITSNFVHIIIIAYKLFMKVRNEKNERRTSNRRAYGYSNE